MTLSPEWIFGSLITILGLVLGFAFKQISDLSADLEAVRKALGG